MKIDFLPIEKKPVLKDRPKNNLILLFLVGILFFAIGFLVRQLAIRDLEPDLTQELNYDIKQEITALTLTNLAVAPKQVPIGAQVRVSFKVTNKTDVLVTESIPVFIKGDAVYTRYIIPREKSPISIPAGESKEFYFYHLAREIGEFIVTAGNQSVSFEVIDEVIPKILLVDPLMPLLKVTAIDVPNEVFVGEEIPVTIVVENSAKQGLVETIEIFVAEEEIYSFEVFVPAKTTEIFFYELPSIERPINALAITVEDKTDYLDIIELKVEKEPEPEPIRDPEQLDDLAIVQLREQIIMNVVEQASLSFVAIESKTTLGTIAGSGFIVSSDGLVLTNKHVVLPAGRTVLEYKVIIENKDEKIEFLADLKDYDPFQDLAILQIRPLEVHQPLDFPFLRLGNSDLLRPGQTVIFIGNLLGRFPKSVNKGIIAYLNRDIYAVDDFQEIVEINNAIQITAFVNFGNSGGPLLDLNGEVIGMVTAKGAVGQEIGFALPSNALKEPLQEIKQYGRIIHPFLGIVYQDLGLEFIKEHNYPGFLIIEVTLNSPAYNFIRQGDIVIEINEQAIEIGDSLGETIRQYAPGDKIDITIFRDNEKIIITDIILEERKDS